MSFGIIDQGHRIKTPLRSLFPDKGVDKMSASTTAHSGTHPDKDWQTKNNEFRNILDTAGGHREEPTPGTYDALKPKSPAQKKPGLMAAQIMSTAVHRVAEGTIVHSAWERMQELNVSHLMVEDINGRPVGILSSKDILALGPDSTLSITNYYSQKIIVGSAHTEVAQIAACFIEFEINAVPIFDHNDQLIGIVCRSDLLRLLISGAHVESWA